jgi:hypothetical protein
MSDLVEMFQQRVGLLPAAAAATAGALFYYMFKSPPALKFDVSLDNQSLEMEVNLHMYSLIPSSILGLHILFFLGPDILYSETFVIKLVLGDNAK